METWQKDLVNRVCASETFRNLRHLGELLLYLAQHSHTDDRHMRKESVIQERVFKHLNVTIATEMTRLQSHLDKYFQTWGRREDRRIVIRRAGKGQKPADLYALGFPLNVAAEVSTKRFWRPHLDESRPTTIVYTEPRFTRDAKTSRFFRDVRRNNESDPVPRGQFLCYPYVPIGEIDCLLQLKRWFMAQGRLTTEQGVRAESRLRDVRPYPKPSDFILLGSPRANGVIRTLQDQQRWKFVVHDTYVTALGQDGRLNRYREKNQDRSVVAYVLVGRFQAPHGNWVTMFYGNHGKAIERMGYLFTIEAELSALFDQSPHLERCVELGRSFQFLFEVRIEDSERDPGIYRLCESDHYP